MVWWEINEFVRARCIEQDHCGYMYRVRVHKKKTWGMSGIGIYMYLISDRIGWGANRNIIYLSIAGWNKLSQGRVGSHALRVSSYLFLMGLSICKYEPFCQVSVYLVSVWYLGDRQDLWASCFSLEC